MDAGTGPWLGQMFAAELAGEENHSAEDMGGA